MTELKPCPFCGNTPELIKENGGWSIYCKHHSWPKGNFHPTTIAGDIGLVSWGDTEEAKESVIGAWNTRAERTCTYEWCSFGNPDDPMGCYEAWNCSNCGEIDEELEEPPTYCLSCGAKVVE